LLPGRLLFWEFLEGSMDYKNSNATSMHSRTSSKFILFGDLFLIMEIPVDSTSHAL
jgi:hypothetical protein